MKYCTLVPQQDGLYSSFPTCTIDNDKLIVFYRQAKKDDQGGHGTEGQIRRFEVDLNAFARAFDHEGDVNLYDAGKDEVVFQEDDENEMDCIVTALDDKGYALVTRIWTPKVRCDNFISVNTNTYFTSREKLVPEGLVGGIYYGKILRTNNRYYLTAYGTTQRGDPLSPLLIVSNDLKNFEFACKLPIPVGDTYYNESSVIHDGEKYIVLIRSDRPRRAIWKTTSKDLTNWSELELVVENAQAPMAFRYKDETYCLYRDWSVEDLPSLSYCKISDPEGTRTVIESYKGNPYDGAYSDVVMIDEQPYVVYYLGNELAEPYIRACRLDIE